MSISSQSPRANRASTNPVDQYAKGEVQEGIKPMRKDGGPENAAAWDVKSDLSIESVNKRADR